MYQALPLLISESPNAVVKITASVVVVLFIVIYRAIRKKIS